MTSLLVYAGRNAIEAQCSMRAIRIICDGLWLGAGMILEESGQASFQVILRAAQEEAVSTGRIGEYHRLPAK